MASKATIREFSTLGPHQKGIIGQLPEENSDVVSQTEIDYSGGATASAAFANTTRMVRVMSDSAFRYEIAADPTATATSDMWAANFPLEFSVPASSGLKISIIAQ